MRPKLHKFYINIFVLSRIYATEALSDPFFFGLVRYILVYIFHCEDLGKATVVLVIVVIVVVVVLE